jgi:hypothetical protein
MPSVKKKIPYYLLIFLLTLGAIAIIGLLSFTGMFTLVPIVSLAVISFVLSVAYEGEIYLQNIKGAFNKLTKHKHLEHQLANAYLLRSFENGVIDTKAADCPQFFKDYENQLKLLHKFSHKRLDEASEARKKKIEKSLKDMEKWFANRLYAKREKDNQLTEYELELRDWLIIHGQNEEKALRRERETTYNGMKLFSVICGTFMSIGVGYLLVEALTVLGGIVTLSVAASPAVIIPLALVAGTAYVLLIYNSVTNMIHNDSLRKWYYEIKKELEKGITFRRVATAIAAVLLFILAVSLTLCTCGTWWTIAKAAGMPSFFSGLLATLLGSSQLIFNLENTSESLKMIDEAAASEKGFFAQLGEGLVKIYHRMRDQIDNENWLQIINLPRILIFLTVTPLRLIAFAGHLIAIGVTADRVPGIPEIVSAILGIISEGFEDFHFFFADLVPHKHGHTTNELLKQRLEGGHCHDHENDIPTRIIHFIFLPVYAAAAAWDWLATRLVGKEPLACRLIKTSEESELSFDHLKGQLGEENGVVLHNNELYYAHQRSQKIKKIKPREDNRADHEALKKSFDLSPRNANVKELEGISALTGRHGAGKPLSWDKAWDKHRGLPPIEAVKLKENVAKPSEAWQLEQSLHCVDNYIEKQLDKAQVNKELATSKATALRELRRDLKQMEGKPIEAIKERISKEAEKPVYGQHRFFSQEGATASEDFLQNLPERISSAATAA